MNTNGRVRRSWIFTGPPRELSGSEESEDGMPYWRGDSICESLPWTSSRPTGRITSSRCGEPIGLDDLLGASDVVFIACPYTPHTERLIGAGAFRLMKNSAFLVNTARGPIVDEAALVDALRSGEIAGAGLDVFETEPLPETSPLWEMENAIITTHSAGASNFRPQRTVDFFCENLRRFMAGAPLLNETDRNVGLPHAGQAR